MFSEDNFGYPLNEAVYDKEDGICKMSEEAMAREGWCSLKPSQWQGERRVGE